MIIYTVTATISRHATGNLVNTVTVTNPPGLPDPNPGNNTSTDTDTPLPGITIVKKTNGTDNNAVPGPNVLVGSPVTWT